MLKSLLIVSLFIASAIAFSAPLPPDYCGKNILKVTSSLEKIDEEGKFSCNFYDAHCINPAKQLCKKLKPIPKNYCGKNGEYGKLVIVHTLRHIGDGKMSCYERELHCVKQSSCPMYAQLPPNYCMMTTGDAAAELKVESVLRKIDTKRSCYFYSAHCVKQEICPQL